MHPDDTEPTAWGRAVAEHEARLVVGQRVKVRLGECRQERGHLADGSPLLLRSLLQDGVLVVREGEHDSSHGQAPIISLSRARRSSSVRGGHAQPTYGSCGQQGSIHVRPSAPRTSSAAGSVMRPSWRS
jgi:hypothetical protein